MSNIRPGKMGKYDLQEQLGRGGMGEVWRAFDEQLHRYVALKFLRTNRENDPAFVARFVREARASASLRHPNIVQVYDFETPEPKAEQPQAFMAMAYIEGPTLSDYLSQTSRVRAFPTDMEILSLFFSLSEAVDYAHQNGVLHRDIKPANILLDSHQLGRNPMGEPILTDFGIAKMLRETGATVTSFTLGTPHYIAPEQALGHTVSAASDIYSLSVVLYEMFAGRLPFVGEHALSILQQHITNQPPSPELFNVALSPAVAAVILRGLAKDPAARFPNAMALTRALAAALNIPLLTSRRDPISSPDIRTLHSASDLNSPPASVPDQRGLPVSLDQISNLPTRLLIDPAAGGNQVTMFAKEYAVRPASHEPETPFTLVDTPISPSPPERDRPSASAVPRPFTLIPAPPTWSRKHRRDLLVLAVCLLVVLFGSGLAAFLRFRATATDVIVGQAFFTSTDAGSGMDNLGLNDQFQVTLSNIPQPSAGTQYYAWLMPDQIQTEASPLSIGTLTVNNGVATLPNPYVDPQHQNLLAQFSRFLVTEEPTNPFPQSPSFDTHLWRYDAEIPQSSGSIDCQGAITQLSALCHLRHLLSGDPELALVNLQGGLNFWFQNNIEDVQHWATEAVTHTDPTDVRHKIMDVLYLLDGTGCIAQDVQRTAPTIPNNMEDDGSLMTIAAFPLLDCALTPSKPGFLTHIHHHLNELTQASGILTRQVMLATQIGTELDALNQRLIDLQKDAEKLIAMNDDQLMQAQGMNIRSALSGLATNVLSGGTDPTTGALQPGAASISAQIQQLATMDVAIYRPQ